MRWILFALLLLMMLPAGCTQPSGTGPAIPPALASTAPAGLPTMGLTMEETTMPAQNVTIVRHISQVREIKDTELLFSLQVPVEWNVSTYRIKNPDSVEGLSFRTNLQPYDGFYIETYAISRNQDQAYRDRFREWIPEPEETAVTVNGITFDRFESESGGRENVSYVVRKSSANERGFASIIFYSANKSHRFEQEDFETVISTFRYFPNAFAAGMPGDEIPRIPAPTDSSPGAISRTGSSEPSVSTGSSGCSRCGG